MANVSAGGAQGQEHRLHLTAVSCPRAQVYTLEQVAEHASPERGGVWIAIDHRVYDV